MPACGIDFGTSNSALALAGKDGVRLAAVEDMHDTLPTALFYAPHLKTPATGRAAQRLFFEGEEGRFMRSLKRILGTPLMRQGTAVNGRTRKFDAIIGDFIAHMKARAERQAGGPLDHAVMGRPVHFADGDAAADRAAEEELARIARACGFRHVAFQFEPIAAAFAHEQKVARETLALVVDIGGGTSDFTLIKICADYAGKADRRGDILGNSGVRIGGNDFDKQLSLAAFMPDFGYRSTYGDKALAVPASPFHDMSEWSKVNFLYTPRFRQEMRELHRASHAPEKLARYLSLLEHETGHRLLAAVEEAKIALTRDASARAALDFIAPGYGIGCARRAFDDCIAAEMAEILAALHRCLSGAGVAPGDVGMVILTGGPTETPLLQQAVRRLFPAAAVSEENRMASVALGLGYDSRRVFGATTS